MNKTLIRKELLNLRKNLPDVSDILIEKIKESHILDNYQNIGIYYPLKNEVNLLKLTDIYKDKVFYFPKTKGDSIAFFKSSNYKNFLKGPFGVMEPKEDKEMLRDDIEVFIIPCVGIDKQNRRIGYGKGYYDRYLSGYSGKKIAAIHKALVLDFDICDSYDVMIDMVFVGE